MGSVKFDLPIINLTIVECKYSKIDNDILSPTFLQLIDVNINGHKLDNRFIAISHAIDTLYQDERTDLIPYAPPSVFYNMIDLLEDYDKAIQGLDALLYKSGCFIYQFPSKSKISGATYDAIKTSNYILEQKSNGSVISIQKDADIKDFPLSNINGLIEAVNKLEDAITKALNDTPASILFDRQLSNGFSNGDKDKETEIQIVNTFRQNKIKPLYELTDYYVMLKAWNEDFINEIKEKYTDLSKYSNIQLFKKWQEDFVFEFGNLYPEPESITIENNSKKLDNLLKLQQLGANASDIEAELNEDRIFKNDIDLDGQPQQFDNSNDNENNQIDYNLYKSIFGKSKKLTKYIDSNVMIDEEPPEGHEWKTLKNGEHVLINSESGEIVSGIGGAKVNKKSKKGLDNSDNNNILNNRKGNNTIKEGDKDGRQQKDKQQSTSEERKRKIDRAVNKIRKWMDGRASYGAMSIIDKRRGGKGARNGLVEYSIEAKPEIKAIFKEADLPTPAFNQLKKNDSKAIDTFKNAIAKAKQSLGDNGASVELKDDYTDINLYLSEDGESGFGIKPNGDIVSVFSNNKAEGGRSHYMLEMATAEGGRQLDCFDIYLTKIYEAHGFEPVAKMKWDDQYIPDGWNKDNFKDYNNGEPDVVFMVYDPKNKKLNKKQEERLLHGRDGQTYREYTEIMRALEYDPDDEDAKEELKELDLAPIEIALMKFCNEGSWKLSDNMTKQLTDIINKQKPNDMFSPARIISRDDPLFATLQSLKKGDAIDINALSFSAIDIGNGAEFGSGGLMHTSNDVRIKIQGASKYIDIGTYSEYPEESEIKVAGKYKLVSILENEPAYDEIETGEPIEGTEKLTYVFELVDNKNNKHIDFADAKKEFDESKIKRDKNGRFAKKNEKDTKDTDNKGTDDKSNSDNSEITEDDRVKFISNIDYLISGMSISDSVYESRAEGIKKVIASGRLGTVADIDKDIKYNKELEKTDKDKYNKYKEYKETAEYKEKMKQAINQFEGDTKATAEKLLPENLQAGELILDDKFEYGEVIDKEKIQKLNPIEKAINYFTENFKNRNKQGFKKYQKEIKDLINKSIPKEISLYRYETEQAGKKRYNLKVGDTIDMSVRSFCDSEKAFENCRALQLRNREPNECIIYKVEGAVKSLEIQSLSEYTSQYEHIVDGDFEITEIREATKLMPKIITIKQKVIGDMSVGV